MMMVSRHDGRIDLFQESRETAERVTFRYPVRQSSAKALCVALVLVFLAGIPYLLPEHSVKPGWGFAVMAVLYGGVAILLLRLAFRWLWTHTSLVIDRARGKLVCLARTPFSKRRKEWSLSSLKYIGICGGRTRSPVYLHVRMLDGSAGDLGAGDREEVLRLASRLSELTRAPIRDLGVLDPFLIVTVYGRRNNEGPPPFSGMQGPTAIA